MERAAGRGETFKQLAYTFMDEGDDCMRVPDADGGRGLPGYDGSGPVGKRKAQIGSSYVDACDIAAVFCCR